jgi:hypothetical protein
MNSEADDNYDFYSELNKPYDDADIISKKCFISHEPLTYNSITLHCDHTFNYLSLYNELLTPGQKFSNKIICPYCRVTTNKLIPFIPLPDVIRVPCINSPEKHCMPAPLCCWKITVGKHKGHVCGINGIEYEHGTYCLKHFNKTNVNEDWTTEMELLFKTKTMVELKQSLKAAGKIIGGTKKELIKRLINI